MYFFILYDGIIIRVSGVQVPPPLPRNLNEIDQIYQSHLIYGEIRIRFEKPDSYIKVILHYMYER